MMPDDFSRFEALIRKLEDVYSKKFTDEAMQAYWRALKDLPFEQVAERVNTHIRFGKFVPKPVELRPREDRPTESNSTVEAAFQIAVQKNIASWEERKGETGFKWSLLEAYLARVEVEHEPGTAAYLDKMDFATSCARKFLDQPLEPGAHWMSRNFVVARLAPHRLLELRQIAQEKAA